MSTRSAMPEMFDGKLPLTLLVTLMLHLAAAIWWVSAKDRDALFLDHRVAALENGLTNTANTQNTISERLARIEERLNADAAILARIDKQLALLHR